MSEYSIRIDSKNTIIFDDERKWIWACKFSLAADDNTIIHYLYYCAEREKW